MYWRVTVLGYPPFRLLSSCSHAEALEYCRVIWPGCTVEIES